MRDSESNKESAVPFTDTREASDFLYFIAMSVLAMDFGGWIMMYDDGS